MKRFTKKLTNKELRHEICKFAKEQGVSKVIFNNRAKKVGGTYNANSKVLFLSLNQRKADLLRTFFHELGHHEAARQNKWKNFHFNLAARISANTIFNIENKIDQLGKKLWHKHVDLKRWGMYKYFYPKSQKTNIIKNFITTQ